MPQQGRWPSRLILTGPRTARLASKCLGGVVARAGSPTTIRSMPHADITKGPLVAIVTRARALRDEGATPTGRWSFAQICRHLSLAIEATLVNSSVTIGGERAAGSGFVRCWLFRRITLTAGYIPAGIPVPDGVYPAESASEEEELAHLESAALDFEAAALDRSRTWPGQRYMGRLSAAQWRRFHHVHAAHHFAYLAQGGESQSSTLRSDGSCPETRKGASAARGPVR